MFALRSNLTVMVMAFASLAGQVFADDIGTAFTYQGSLEDGSGAVTDTCDFSFRLYDAAAGGNLKGTNPQTKSGTSVTDGVFTISDLDFGPGSIDGTARWLEIGVCCSSPCMLFTLSPRVELTPAPHALALPGVYTEPNGLHVVGGAGIGTVPASDTQLYVQTSSDGFNLLADVDGAPGGRLGLRTSFGGWASLVKNAYYDLGGGTGWNRFDAAKGAFLQEIDPDGNVTFGVAEAGAGTISWTNSLWLDKSGKVGVGTDAPTARLEADESDSARPAIQGVHTAASNDTPAIRGSHAVSDGFGIGIEGEGGSTGVYGIVTPMGVGSYYGVSGIVSGGSGTNYGVSGAGFGGDIANYGVSGHASGNGMVINYGAYGTATGTGALNWAGYFDGNVHVNGTLSKNAGSFKIDHPLDPENKYLYHSFVESPDMKNIYDGIVTLDAEGTAWVQMPEWFDALNRNFRYQLTCIGGFAPVYIAQEVSENRFKIAGGTPGMKVSWTVTGIRQDAYANTHRIPLEELKSPQDRGKFLHPQVFGEPEERGIDFVHRDPEKQAQVEDVTFLEAETAPVSAKNRGAQ